MLHLIGVQTSALLNALSRLLRGTVTIHKCSLWLPSQHSVHTLPTEMTSNRITITLKPPATPATSVPTPTPSPPPPSVPTPSNEPTPDTLSNVPAPSTTPIDAADAVEAFLAEETLADKLSAINRILTSFTLNPLTTLALPTAPSLPSEQINRQYRTLSLLVHPDKIASDHRGKAQQAFARLADARAALLDEEKREVLEELISQARQLIITERETDPKRRVRSDGSIIAADGYDATKDADFDSAVEAAVREMMIDKEWAKRQRMKLSSASEGREEAEKEQRKREREEKAKEDEEFESKREGRVSSWRAFQQGAAGSKKRARVGMMSGPKASAMDGQHSYVRRAVG